MPAANGVQAKATGTELSMNGKHSISGPLGFQDDRWNVPTKERQKILMKHRDVLHLAALADKTIRPESKSVLSFYLFHRLNRSQRFGQMYPGLIDTAARLKTSKGAIQRALKQLVEHDYLRTIRKGGIDPTTGEHLSSIYIMGHIDDEPDLENERDSPVSPTAPTWNSDQRDSPVSPSGTQIPPGGTQARVPLGLTGESLNTDITSDQPQNRTDSDSTESGADAPFSFGDEEVNNDTSPDRDIRMESIASVLEDCGTSAKHSIDYVRRWRDTVDDDQFQEMYLETVFHMTGTKKSEISAEVMRARYGHQMVTASHRGGR